MRIAVVGVGGVGGYFGARLAEAGEQVAFVARGAHLEAIKARGLRVESVAGDVTIAPAEAAAHPADIGRVDVVLVGVKTWQVGVVAQTIAPVVGPDTLVVPLQNGVEAAGQLAAVLDEPGAAQPHVIGGLCRIMSMAGGPGLIRHIGIAPYIAFNRLDGQPDERVERLRAALARAKGVTVEVPQDIWTALWAKFAFIAPFGGVGAVTRVPAGDLRSVPETRKLLEAAIREVELVGRAWGAKLAENVVAQTMSTIDALPEVTTASMQRDLMEGKPSELEAQNGAVVRLGNEKGVPTPVHEFIYASLLPQEKRARG